MISDWASPWRVEYLDTDGSKRIVEVEATEAWTEGGRTAFLHRQLIGNSMTVRTVLEILDDRLVSYKRL
jgi:hypothetical protein